MIPIYQRIKQIATLCASNDSVQLSDIRKATGCDDKIVKKILNTLLEEGIIFRKTPHTPRSYGTFAITEKGKELING